MPEYKEEGRLSPGDPNSYSRPEIAKVIHVNINWDVNFDKKILDGFVILTIERVDPKANEVILDTRNLDIISVSEETSEETLIHHLGEEGYAGSKLSINLPQGDANHVKIKITYRTTLQCSGLQWLDPNLTFGKTHPYMFSQCQAIHCRSLIPLQDTPLVKSKYCASITAPDDLTVLMSAVRQGEPECVGHNKKVHKFQQEVPIQSYLIAIVVGKLESRRIGPRSHVWSEKEIVDKAAFEFSETEIMLRTAEELCGPYIWGIYDILVLPPSFPFGGMENPCLTFVTPSLLAGDRSLAGVIAHEIAHSWTGNLVTNKNFEHFWLNEGFTVFIERKIVGRMKGEAMRNLDAINGWKNLHYAIEVLGQSNPLTALVVDLKDVDPDDAFSSVPYEKGSAFLWYLEEIVGGSETFEPFLRKYFETYQHCSIDSDDFKRFFMEYFSDNPNIQNIDWQHWYYSPGMLTYNPNYDDTLAKECRSLCERWIKWNEESEACPMTNSDVMNFSADQLIEFLSQLLLEEPLSKTKLEKLEELYSLNQYNNFEIKFNWIRVGLKAKWKEAIPHAVKMVADTGRMKFLRPIYRDLFSWDFTKALALETFEKNKQNMMHVAIHGLKQDLQIN